MAAMQGWQVFIDPAWPAGGGVANRALDGTTLDPIDSPLVFGTSPDGQPAMVFDEESRRLEVPVALPATSWSAFFVVRISDDPLMNLMRSKVDSTGSELSLRVFLSASVPDFVMYENVATERLRLIPAVPLLNRTAMLMITFSTLNGIVMYENGVQGAAAPNDKRPITAGIGPFEWEMFRTMRGAVGMCGLIGLDLSLDRYAGYRRAIDRFLLAKYGIAASSGGTLPGGGLLP